MYIALIIGYLVCSFLAWGLSLGAFTKEYPQFRHTGFAAGMAILGPGGLLAGLFSLMLCGFAFQITPFSKEQRWQAFDKRYGPYLTREYFESRD